MDVAETQTERFQWEFNPTLPTENVFNYCKMDNKSILESVKNEIMCQ